MQSLQIENFWSFEAWKEKLGFVASVEKAQKRTSHKKHWHFSNNASKSARPGISILASFYSIQRKRRWIITANVANNVWTNSSDVKHRIAATNKSEYVESFRQSQQFQQYHSDISSQFALAGVEQRNRRRQTAVYLLSYFFFGTKNWWYLELTII
jgi:hypothetical protein